MYYNGQTFDPYANYDNRFVTAVFPDNLEDYSDCELEDMGEDLNLYYSPYPYHEEYDDWKKYGDNGSDWVKKHPQSYDGDYTPKDGWTQYENGGQEWEDWRNQNQSKVNSWLQNNQDLMPKK